MIRYRSNVGLSARFLDATAAAAEQSRPDRREVRAHHLSIDDVGRVDTVVWQAGSPSTAHSSMP
jgi:hypothetical protein